MVNGSNQGNVLYLSRTMQSGRKYDLTFTQKISGNSGSKSSTSHVFQAYIRYIPHSMSPYGDEGIQNSTAVEIKSSSIEMASDSDSGTRVYSNNSSIGIAGTQNYLTGSTLYRSVAKFYLRNITIDLTSTTGVQDLYMYVQGPTASSFLGCNLTNLAWTITPYYRIQLNANGGSYSSSTSKWILQNSTLGSFLGTPTRDGYMFDGWYTEPTAGTKVEETTKSTSDTTYYAHWTPNITITYHSNWST